MIRQIEYDGNVYDRDGNVLGVVVGMVQHRHPIEVTTHMDATPRYVAGIAETTLSVRLAPGLSYRPQDIVELWTCGYCAGKQPHRRGGELVTQCGNCGGPRR